MRILSHQALATKQLIRLALRSGLIEDYHWEGKELVLLVGGSSIRLPEREARIFLWGLIRGRERTLSQFWG